MIATKPDIHREVTVHPIQCPEKPGQPGIDLNVLVGIDQTILYLIPSTLMSGGEVGDLIASPSPC
jgi:hypothetical protein